MKSIGLDIGTTTICGILLDAETGQVLQSETRKNNSIMKGENQPFEKLQDPEQIVASCNQMIELFLEMHTGITHIGVTGQMHGVLYVDQEGNAVTPLYSWQDDRGNCLYKDGITYSEYATNMTGYRLATGFGATTHFYNQENQCIPEAAVSFCTIPDFIAMKLAQRTKPLVHQSMAASIGMFRIENGMFDEEAVRKLHMDISYFPTVETREIPIGSHKSGMSVSMALGDNQASFLGSVGAESNTLLNIGTGSQISVFAESYCKQSKVEYRPYISNTYLMVGAPLCGGASYAMLKNFYQKVLEMFGYEEPEDMYQRMNSVAETVYDDKNKMTVDTRFNGTREQPSIKGSISQIGVDTFTPEQLTMSMIRGICEELYNIYNHVPEENKQSTRITGSGNGIRNNPLLRKVAQDVFGKELCIPNFGEEASFGVALYTLYCDGVFQTMEEMRNMIQKERGSNDIGI